MGLEPICQYYKVYLLQLKLFQIDFALKTIKWSNAVKWCCIIERLFWILRQWIRWHLDFICMFWALLCQNGFVGKKETWCCVVVFLEIFEAGGHAVVSYWIACFLLTTRHQKIFVPPDVWCQCLPRQCSRACSLVYFPLACPVPSSSGHLFYYPSDMVCHFLLQKVELSLLADWSEGSIMQRGEGKWRNTPFWECYR